MASTQAGKQDVDVRCPLRGFVGVSPLPSTWGQALSPFGQVFWAPCCLGTGWPDEHLAFGDCFQLGKLPNVLYWRTGVFARLLISLSPSTQAWHRGGALGRASVPLGQVLKVPKFPISPGKLAFLPVTWAPTVGSLENLCPSQERGQVSPVA